MTFLGLLYQLIISPITLMLQGVYSLAYHFLQSCGASIFPLSLVVNLLLLPFYRRADAMQKEERDRQKSMEPFISHIKKTFKGDERYMMLQTYYRQNNYKPVYALRSSVALLLEVPFFIAAFHFLSNLQDMKFAEFGILSNLGSPDGLLTLGSIHINVLPVLMTLINVISSEIYAKGMKLKEKLQLHGMALIFLVLLYNSPSGLVLYWTLNNVFSLVKNIVSNSKDKRRTASMAFSVLGGLILVYSFFFNGNLTSKLVIIAAGVLCQIPLFVRPGKTSSVSCDAKAGKSYTFLFVSGAAYLSILLGLLIPSGVIASSASEFILRTSVHSPVRYVFYSFLTAAGAFVLWGGLFFYLADQKKRKWAVMAVWAAAVTGTLNYFAFGKSDSLMSSDLKFDAGLSISSTGKYIDLALVILLTVIMCFVIGKQERIVRFMAPVLIAVVAVISGFNIYTISAAMPDIRRLMENSSSEIPEIPFSKDGKNVIVFMLDRSISSYVPYMFQERPELAEQFSGFTYYPNTLSFGTRTVVAAPALFGGYDYTPAKINERSDDMLRTKYDEALLTMPVLFDNAGYEVTVLDPPFAGFSEIPDLSIYDPYPGIKAYNTETGFFRDSDETDQALKETWKRNFFCYSLMKTSPLILQPVIYTGGTYFEPVNNKIDMNNPKDTPGKFTVSSAYMNYFRDSYLALKALPSMTEVSGDQNSAFVLIQNGTAHNTMPLKEPEYEPAFEFDNTAYDEAHRDRFTYEGKTIRMDDNYQLAHYQCNMAAFIQIGNWLDYLREIGVYDNTRIIIVSDHGWPLGQFDDMILFDGVSDTMYNSEDAMAYNPLLLYKDFGSDEPFTADYTFMTNADTPYLAMNGLIDDPLNPFTQGPVFQPDAKNADKLYIMYTDNWSLEGNTDTVFTNTLWYSLRNQNVFDKNNWAEETEP